MKRAIPAFLLLFLSACEAPVATEPSTGHDTGNGGDALPIVFQEARVRARRKIEDLAACEFGPRNDAAIVGWLIDHQDALARDIESSPHRWEDISRSRCGWTQNHPGAPVSLSYDACRVLDLEGASKTLIHESVHHLNGPDERFADSVVAEIYEALPENCVPNEGQIEALEMFRPDWPKTLELTVAVEGDKVCFDYPRPNWPSIHVGGEASDSFDGIGNYWLVFYTEGRWTQATYEWLLANERCQIPDFGKLTAYGGLRPQRGDRVGFFLSTVERGGFHSMRRERTPIAWIWWPWN